MTKLLPCRCGWEAIKIQYSNNEAICENELCVFNLQPLRYPVWNTIMDVQPVIDKALEKAAVVCETECARNDGITCAEEIRTMKGKPL